MKLNELKPAGYNPRAISDEQLQRLKKSLQEFGDLSGIVFNRRTGNLVGGHQRLKCLPPDAKIEKKDLKEKTKTGTVAHGFIILDSERYTYREVDWDEAKEKQANIAANKHGGEWDDEKLASLLHELSEMPDFDPDLIGFETKEMDEILNELENTGTMRKAFGHDEAPDSDSSDENAMSIDDYPITFILSAAEYENWQNVKKKYKVKDDKKCLLSIIQKEVSHD